MKPRRPECPRCEEDREISPEGQNFVCEVCGLAWPQYVLTPKEARRIARVGRARFHVEKPKKAGAGDQYVSASLILEEAEAEAFDEYAERVERRRSGSRGGDRG